MKPALSDTDPLLLVPGDRFFVKRVGLDPAAPAAAQVEIALEESSPFPLAQMYHGFVRGADGRHALAYAAYRRRFTPAESTEWTEAGRVLPDFLALLGPKPAGPAIVLLRHSGGISGAAWDGSADLPAIISVQPAADPGETHVTAMVAELSRQAGISGATVRRLNGPAGAGATADGGVVFRAGGEETCRLSAADAETADVRDKAFLGSRHRDERRRRVWWGAFLAIAALWLLAAAVEIGAGVMGVRNRQRLETVTRQAGEVVRIETAETLAKRVEDLSARPERPFEWLAAAGAARPRSVQFLRAASRGGRTLEIEAQSADAADAGAYEAALRELPQVESVETRELRAREGLTSFIMAVKFKAPGSASMGGAR